MESRHLITTVLILFIIEPANQSESQEEVPEESCNIESTRQWMKMVNNLFDQDNLTTIIRSVEKLEKVLGNTCLNQNKTTIREKRLVTHLYKPEQNFRGLSISEEVTSGGDNVTNAVVGTVTVKLPREILGAGEFNHIVFCMITSSEKYGPLGVLDGRVVGVSVNRKNISGLQERVNISMPLLRPSLDQHEGKKPSCQFFIFSNFSFSSDGCSTHWEPGQDHVLCSCDHLTYFAVLLITPDISEPHQVVLSYISLIGCSISLLFLLFTILLYLRQRPSGPAAVSLKLHLNLAAALILLNLHFIPSQHAAEFSSSGPCVYLAVLLHYSLLATFSWTAIEGFHLYLLLVRVFNIYVRRYLLKLSLVGWGIPAVIVVLVVILDREAYGRVILQPAEANVTAVHMCYLSNEEAKVVTTTGLFGLVLLFNLCVMGVVVRRVFFLRAEESGGVGRNLCTLLGVTCLLGVSWGLVFFSFGQLTTVGLYLFCVLNSLQGFFIFLWFWVSKWKAGESDTGSEMHSTRT